MAKTFESATAEHRFGAVDRVPETIEWLSKNWLGYIAHETKRFAREMGLGPLTIPVESPRSNGTAKALVWTINRDYARVARLPDTRAILAALPRWFAHYNAVQPL